MKEPLSSQQEYERWYEGELMRVGNAIVLPGEPMQVFSPMPLIRCTVKPACGHCFYCQHAKGKR